MTTTTALTALTALRDCRSSLLTARVDAITAATRLDGARRDRAGKLAEQLAGALAHCERLAVVVEGDLRAGFHGSVKPSPATPPTERLTP